MNEVTRVDLHRELDRLLEPGQFHDYAPNGLQVEGAERITKVVTGVSANQALIDESVRRGANALVVHHGFFWKNEPRTLTGIRARRVRALLAGNISLFGYHLPLDAHPTVGNNAGLLRALGADPTTTFDAGAGVDGTIGELPTPITRDELVGRAGDACGRDPLVFAHGPDSVRRVGVCTGGGAGFFEAAVAAGVDAFVTGEPAEWSEGVARELDATFIAAGHHATERFGPRRLGEWIAERFGIEVEFVDISNPV